MVMYSLDWYAWGRLLHIRSTILKLDIKHAWEIETTASWKRLNWDHHCFWLIREQTQLQSSIQGLWYHLTCTNCFLFGPDRLTPIQRVSLTTSCPQFSNTQSMTRLECVKPALTWYSHERPSDRFFSLTGVWNQVAVKLPPASHPSFVRFDASQYLRRDEACRYQLLCTEDRILPPSVRSSRAVGWETPHYTASEWQPNSLKDHHGSCWAIRIYFPLPICTPYIEARAVFKSIQTSWRINPWLFLICRSTDCRWEWDCDIEVDSALTSPIVLEPPPNLFPVMTIGRHYEDRRAHERRILPNPPQHGHHGVFLLYGVTRTEYSALVPSPTIWALFRKKNFFFSVTHANSWDLRFWAWTASLSLPSKHDLDHLDSVPGCWIIQVRSQVRARKVAFPPSQRSSKKWDTLLHALTSAIQKILPIETSWDHTLLHALRRTWHDQPSIIVSFRTLPLVPGDPKRLSHDVQTMGRYRAATGTLSQPSSRVIRTSRPDINSSFAMDH